MQNGFQSYDKKVVNTLFESFTLELEEIKFSHPETIDYSKRSAELSRRYVEELKRLIQTTTFQTPPDEIEFFKHLKPLFSTQLIYHSELYHLGLRTPQGSKRQIEDFFMDEYDRINLFFGLHIDFFKYYKAQATNLDHLYFVRGNINQSIALHYAEFDDNFSTGYDLLIARFRANDLLSDYLTKAIERITDNPNIKARLNSEFTWTAPIVAFAEFIMALDAHAVFNNAPVGIGKLCVFFAPIFNLDPINIHKKAEEIRIRKKNRTVFLDALKNSLIRKMELDDEHAQ